MKLKQVFCHDFCPGLNRYVYWLRQPIGWIAFATLAALLVALFQSPSAWWIVAACVVVGAIQLAWPWIQLRCCRCEISFDRDRAVEGEPVIAYLHVINRAPFPLWGLAVEKGFLGVDSQLLEEEGDSGIQVALARVPAFCRNTYQWRFIPQRRGVYPFQPPQVTTGFPFGVWTATRTIRVRGSLVAWPKTGPPRGFHGSSIAAPAAVGEFQDRSGDQGDLLGARLWQPGESLRMVNWAQTAKSEEDLVVTERQTPTQSSVSVLIDLRPHELAGRRQEVSDWQIRVAASLVRYFHEHKYSITVGDQYNLRLLGRSEAALHQWFDELALLDECQYLDAGPLSGLSRRSTTWVITNAECRESYPPASDTLIPVLVTTRDDPRAARDQGGSAVVIDIDEKGMPPLQQLVHSGGAREYAKQAG